MSPKQKETNGKVPITYLSDLGGTRGIPIRRTIGVMTQVINGVEMEVPAPQAAVPPEIRFTQCVPKRFGATWEYHLDPQNRYYDQIRATIEGDPTDPERPGLIRYSPDGPEIAKLVRLLAREKDFQWAPRSIWREDVVKRNLFLYDVEKRGGERRRLVAALASYKGTEFKKELADADMNEKCNYELEQDLAKEDNSLVMRAAEQGKVNAGVATSETALTR
jgi:hypothetical protein